VGILVVNVGALGIDNILNISLLKKEELRGKLDLPFLKKNILVTYHPVTLDEQSSQKNFKNLLTVLDGLKDTSILFTKPNSDSDGRVITAMIDDYVEKNKVRAKSVVSMGTLHYLSALNCVDAVVGNSSSGLIEAPSFKVGTINIGDRQNGRIKAESVIDCNADSESIRRAFSTLDSNEFQKKLKMVVNPHGEGQAAHKIAKAIKAFDFKNCLKKEFYDLGIER